MPPIWPPLQGDGPMRMRTTLAAVTVLAAGALLGWLAASGRLTEVFGQEGKAEPANPFPVKVDRNHYPQPEYRYPNAKISTTFKDSTPDFPKPKSAPEGAPNILLILLDDVGFGCSRAFAGLVGMPTAARVAR